MTASLRPLTPVEARVLGTLMEKARTVPDSYPLSMQALLTGCNQKTTRDPVMNLAESQVAEAIDELKRPGPGGGKQRCPCAALQPQLHARRGRARTIGRAVGVADAARSSNSGRVAHQQRTLVPALPTFRRSMRFWKNCKTVQLQTKAARWW
jgi:hypothetical protein